MGEWDEAKAMIFIQTYAIMVMVVKVGINLMDILVDGVV